MSSDRVILCKDPFTIRETIARGFVVTTVSDNGTLRMDCEREGLTVSATATPADIRPETMVPLERLVVALWYTTRKQLRMAKMLEEKTRWESSESIEQSGKAVVGRIGSAVLRSPLYKGDHDGR